MMTIFCYKKKNYQLRAITESNRKKEIFFPQKIILHPGFDSFEKINKKFRRSREAFWASKNFEISSVPSLNYYLSLRLHILNGRKEKKKK